MKNSLLLALAVAAGFFFGACSPTASKCATTCPGCCDTSGVCQPGSALNACGQGGISCRSCSDTEKCSLSVCSSSGAGGGSGGGSFGGGTGGGTTGSGGGGGICSGAGGGAVAPPDINVAIGTCGTVTPCPGGNLIGSWWFTMACNDDPLADFRQSCPTLTTTTDTTTVHGQIDFCATTMNRRIFTNYSSVVSVPASCNTMGCSTIQALFPVSSTCVASGGGCNCRISGNSSFSETGTWTSNNGVITMVTPSTTRTFNTCVSGGTTPSTPTVMSFREDGAQVPPSERGTAQFTKAWTP